MLGTEDGKKTTQVKGEETRKGQVKGNGRLGRRQWRWEGEKVKKDGD